MPLTESNNHLLFFYRRRTLFYHLLILRCANMKNGVCTQKHMWRCVTGDVDAPDTICGDFENKIRRSELCEARRNL